MRLNSPPKTPEGIPVFQNKIDESEQEDGSLNEQLADLATQCEQVKKAQVKAQINDQLEAAAILTEHKKTKSESLPPLTQQTARFYHQKSNSSLNKDSNIEDKNVITEEK